MTRKTRRWFRPALLLMLAVSAQVPACEYGQHQDGGTQAYRMSLADPPQLTATPHA
jgi:histidine triad (HIT) family protein